MKAERWRAEQIKLREAIRVQRSPIVEPGPTHSDTAASPPASVVVVCWNSEDVLERCLRQLQAQDYPDYEIIIVDDGSRDDTLQVAERATVHGELKIVRSARNRGCPHARNLGLAQATGDIVAFIDADGFAAPNWLRRVVEAFGNDESIGGVASTVFFADNPLVLNGAGGIVNRQGWAADLSMNKSYEHAQIASEALYPMGCGMAVRRSALERVGPFDDRMLNYYDDVDYGIRLWRVGYRVVVAPDAFIDHGFGQSSGETARKRLLCERHRMRVVLKHVPPRDLRRWVSHEMRTLRQARRPHRSIKLRAMAWNVAHLPSVLASRARLRHQPGVPDRLVNPSWGDAFPVGVPARSTPRPETATNVLDMAEPRREDQLLYGWFSAEVAEKGRSRRWADTEAGALIELRSAAKILRLDYTNAPVDLGGVDIQVRRVGAEPLEPVWSAQLPWQYTERTLESRLLNLPAGAYEILFSTERGWSDPPRETRLLSLALARMAFEESYEIPIGGVDMASPKVESQLLSGWFEAEQSADLAYRWADTHAAALVRLADRVSSARLISRFPPGRGGDVRMAIRPVDESEPVWSTHLSWHEREWHEEPLKTCLEPGDYEVTFDAEATWSNQEGQDTQLPPENRSLGFGLSSLSFGYESI
jgi:GT2 family glycosyltransferase